MPTIWVHTSSCIEVRSPKQCGELYHEILRLTLNYDTTSSDESRLSHELVDALGRSAGVVKNWFEQSSKRYWQPEPDLEALLILLIRQLDQFLTAPNQAPIHRSRIMLTEILPPLGRTIQMATAPSVRPPICFKQRRKPLLKIVEAKTHDPKEFFRAFSKPIAIPSVRLGSQGANDEDQEQNSELAS